jgi:hypothetical protein
MNVQVYYDYRHVKIISDVGINIEDNEIIYSTEIK